MDLNNQMPATDLSFTPENYALFHEAYYLVGPTGVGKSEISLALAQKLNAEILALDAMTLYQQMDIGTAKPSVTERQALPHHLIDVISPQVSSSLDRYLALALDVLKKLASSGKAALFVGGSPLYLKACLRGLSPLPSTNEVIRQGLIQEAETSGVESMHQRLSLIDPEAASKIASTDLRRIVRSLEIYQTTGELPSKLRTRHEHPAPTWVPVIALVRDRPELYDRINRRVEAMFAQGLIDETRALPDPLSHTALQAVGYAEAIEVIEGRLSEKEAIERTQLRTRHYAKHQLTWFRGLQEVTHFDLKDRSINENVGLIYQLMLEIRSRKSESSQNSS